MIILYLTCANEAEASAIANELLQQKLVACVRRMPVSSSYWWDNKLNHDNEIMLMMESVEDKFDAIEAVVTRMHSYDEYVLTAVAVHRTTPGVETWLNSALRD